MPPSASQLFESDAQQHIIKMGTAFHGMRVTLVTSFRNVQRESSADIVQQCVHALSLVLVKPKQTICHYSRATACPIH
jgi:hypothetical protein